MGMDLKQSLLRPEVEDDIVADDCVASVRNVRSPLFDLNPVQYNRCDSGFNSGLDQFHQKLDLNSQSSASRTSCTRCSTRGITRGNTAYIWPHSGDIIRLSGSSVTREPT